MVTHDTLPIVDSASWYDTAAYGFQCSRPHTATVNVIPDGDDTEYTLPRLALALSMLLVMLPS